MEASPFQTRATKVPRASGIHPFPPALPSSKPCSMCPVGAGL